MELLAERGERDAAAGPLEQLPADLALQGGDQTLMRGWDTRSFCAAWPKCSSSASARKASACAMSTASPLSRFTYGRQPSAAMRSGYQSVRNPALITACGARKLDHKERNQNRPGKHGRQRVAAAAPVRHKLQIRVSQDPACAPGGAHDQRNCPGPRSGSAGKARSASRGWGALASGSGRGFLIACAVTMLALVTSWRWPAPLPSHARPARAGRLAGTTRRRPRSCRAATGRRCRVWQAAASGSPGQRKESTMTRSKQGPGVAELSTLTSHLVTRDPAAAASWYGSVLGAVEEGRVACRAAGC